MKATNYSQIAEAQNHSMLVAVHRKLENERVLNTMGETDTKYLSIP